VSDNGSSDGSAEFIRTNFPDVRVLENGGNLRFAKGNNVGIRAGNGEYVLILNPDTIVHDGSLDRWIEFADRHPEAGAFGCRVVNSDGSYQGCARPFPTIWREWLAAFYLRFLGYISNLFVTDKYVAWNGTTERIIDWQAGCCLLVRGEVVRQLGGFDEQFQYYYEDLDLCHRIWNAGYTILYTPGSIVTHLGGQSTKNFRPAFEIDKYRNRYRYFYKYFGSTGVRRCRRVALAWLIIRRLGYGSLQIVNPSEARTQRLRLYELATTWNRLVDPVEFVEKGREPEVSTSVSTQVPQ